MLSRIVCAVTGSLAQPRRQLFGPLLACGTALVTGFASGVLWRARRIPGRCFIAQAQSSPMPRCLPDQPSWMIMWKWFAHASPGQGFIFSALEEMQIYQEPFLQAIVDIAELASLSSS
eukprot:1555124-Amphidinium_carterae.1